MLHRQTASAIYRAALVGLAVLFVWLTLRVDLLIFGGILLAACLTHAAGCLQRRVRMPRPLALVVVLAVIFGVLGAVGWFFSNQMASQFGELSQRLSDAVASIRATVEQGPIGHSLLQQVDPEDLLSAGGGAIARLFNVASGLTEVVVGVVVIVFIGVYGAAEPGVYLSGALRLVPPARRTRAAEILAEAGDVLWHWVIGRLCSMALLGVLTAAGLWALGVPVPLALGALAGLLTFVPYVGALVSAVPAVLLGLAAHVSLALYVVLLYLGIHIVEGYVLIPLVQRRAAHLPPALILATQLILGVLAGFLGLLFATPLLAALLVLVRALYVEDVLGDRA